MQNILFQRSLLQPNFVCESALSSGGGDPEFIRRFRYNISEVLLYISTYIVQWFSSVFVGEHTYTSLLES
jgi:hypothetical protein